jgi:hypothetical protein
MGATVDRMRPWSVVLAAALVLGASGASSAQDDGGPGVQIGGSVPSYLSLGFTEPHAFSLFPARPRSATARVSVALHITATDQHTQLSVADGDETAGPTRGRLVDGSRTLASPIEAAVNSPFRSLDAATDPQLAAWSEPIADEPAVLRLRQALPSVLHHRGPYRKLILVTVSASSP